MSSWVLPSALAFALTVIFVPVARALARRLGVVARPAADRWHQGVVPKFGGIALAVAGLPVAWWWTRDSAGHAVMIFAAATCAVGLIDDLRQTRPLVKLASQAVAVVLFLISAPPLAVSDLPVLDAVLTAGWLLLVVNAVNLLDNMDGLAAAVVTTVALFALVAPFGGGDGPLTDLDVIFGVTAGMAAGFLPFNWHRASIFMGDAGSHLLGACLGGATLVAVSATPVPRAATGIAALALLAVPIADATTVAVTRMAAGRHPFSGGRDHLSHRLVARGMGERGAVVTLVVVAALGGIVAWIVLAAPDAGRVLAGAYAVAVAAGAGWLSASRRSTPAPRGTHEPSR